MKKVRMDYIDERGEKHWITMLFSPNTPDDVAMAYMKSRYSVKRHKNAHSGVEIVGFTVSVAQKGSQS